MKKLFILFLTITWLKNSNSQIPTEGLSLWLRADAGVITKEEAVISWDDQSGNHLNAIPLINNVYESPRLIRGILNNHPVIRFNAMNNGMETSPFATFPNKRGTIFIVAKINGQSSTSGVGHGTLLSTYHGQKVVWQFGSNTSRYTFYDGVGGEGLTISTSPPTDWGIVTLMRHNDTMINFYKNGRFQNAIHVYNNQPDINTLKIGFNGRLGNSHDSIPEVLNGDIAEIIIYAKALTRTELSAVHNYLSKKYNLTLQQPPFWERWWFYGLIILSFLAIVFALIQYIDRRKLRKKLHALEKQREIDKERQRISREMHDDIGAGLTQITLMSEAAKRNKTTNEKELEDIATASRKLVSNMSEIIWSLNPDNKTLEQLIAYLREQLDKMLEYSGKKYSIQLPEKIPAIELTNSTRRNLLLVTKEIVNNAIKYSGADKITILGVLEDNAIRMEIADNGIGFDASKIYSGNGLRNVRMRIEELGGKLEIISEQRKGTKFLYRVSLT